MPNLNNISGALWLAKIKDLDKPNTDKNGNQYYIGNIVIDGKKTNVKMFLNSKKTEEKYPDYLIFESK